MTASSKVGETGMPILTARCWVIWSNEHSLFWAANHRGYRKSFADAGRYTFDEAISICKTRSWDGQVPPETMLLDENSLASLPPTPASEKEPT